jgi:hypothetical protein
MKSKLIALAIILILLLSACELTQTPTPKPVEEPAAEVEAPEVVESEPEPQETQAPTEEPEVVETEDPEEEIVTCVELIEPLDGADFAGNTRVTFSWSAHPDAESYLLTFVFPDGLELTFTTDETTLNRYMDGFSMHPAYNQSGEHQWNVSALNAAGEEICQSDFFTFTKPVSDVASEENNSNDENNDDSSCTSLDCFSGGGFEE